MPINDLVPVVAIILVAAVAFFGAFALAKGPLSKEYNVGGLMVVSPGDPQTAFGKVLAKTPVVVWIESASETERVSCRSVAASEIATALGRGHRNLTVEGRVSNSYCLDSGRKRVDCQDPAVVIGTGSEDKIFINDAMTTLTIRGSDKWLCDNAPLFRDMIYGTVIQG